MTKQQAEHMVRNALAGINLPLTTHNQLQQAVNVLVTPEIKPTEVKPPVEEIKK